MWTKLAVAVDWRPSAEAHDARPVSLNTPAPCPHLTDRCRSSYEPQRAHICDHASSSETLTFSLGCEENRCLTEKVQCVYRSLTWNNWNRFKKKKKKSETAAASCNQSVPSVAFCFFYRRGLRPLGRKIYRPHCRKLWSHPTVNEEALALRERLGWSRRCRHTWGGDAESQIHTCKRHICHVRAGA